MFAIILAVAVQESAQFIFHKEPLTFKDSYNWCIERDMDLVQIKTAAQHASFTKLIAKFGSPTIWLSIYHKKYTYYKWTNDNDGKIYLPQQ